MDAEQITQAVQGVVALRPHQRQRRPDQGSAAWWDIERIKEQRALIVEVQGLLPGRASEDEAIAWLDANTPNWRLGPAPHGRTVVLEVTDGD